MKTIKLLFLGAFTSSANEYQLSAAVSLVATAAATAREAASSVGACRKGQCPNC